VEAALRVYVADRDPYASRALVAALDEDPRLEVTAFATAAEIIDRTAAEPPAVALLDDLDEDHQLLRSVRATSTAAALLVVAQRDDDESHALRLLRLGADGFLSKHVDVAVLPRVVRAMARGEVVVSRQLTRRLVDELRSVPTGSAGVRPVRSALSDREWEVLDLLRAGFSTSRVAAELGVCPSTVRSHVKHLLRKLDAASREEAVETAQTLIHAALR
jgi:NarL family two-component system response regulator LiaR